MSRRFEGGRRQLRSIHIDSDLADWLDAYAKRRGVGREYIIEIALQDYEANLVARNLVARRTLTDINRQP